MNLDTIPDQIGQLVEYARAALDKEITGARKVVDSLNGEKAAAAKALAELNDQITRAKADLDAVQADLGRTSTAVRLDREVAKARTELERLKDAIAKESKELEALVKKRTEAEAHVVTLQNDARLATAERARAQEIIAGIKNKLQQWS
jgi:chromosome segregation ATPase